MNRKFGFAGISIIFAMLSACGGGSDSSSSSASPPTPGSHTGTTPPTASSAGGGRPGNVAGFVYAVNRQSNNLTGYEIDTTTRALTAIPGSPFAAGDEPVAITVNPNDRFLYVPNANSHDVSAYSIDHATGALSAVAGSPYSVGEPYLELFRSPSSVSIDPSGRFAYVVAGGDYGIREAATPAILIPGQIWAFSINATTGAWTPISGSPYDVHNNRLPLAFDRQGKFAYASSSASNAYSDIPRAGTISTFAIDASSGALVQVGEPVVTAGFGQTPVSIHPSGKFAYIASDAGMASFSIDPNTGALSSIDSLHGLTQTPYHTVRIDPSGKFVYASDYDTDRNQNGIAAFTIDGSIGRLSEVAGSPYHVGMEYLNPTAPYPVTIDPSGKFVYMGTGGTFFCTVRVPCTLDFEPGKIWAYTINAATGVLSAVAGSPFAIDNEPLSITIDPSGKAAYVLSRGSNGRGNWIVAYTLNTATGALTQIGSYPTGDNPLALVIADTAL